jgi:hypothetical protein
MTPILAEDTFKLRRPHAKWMCLHGGSQWGSPDDATSEVLHGGQLAQRFGVCLTQERSLRRFVQSRA